MSFVEVAFALVKILFVLLFLLNMAAVATWADRRQSAMVQDRIGPNRAVVNLPSNAARIIVLLPPTALGAFAFYKAIFGVRVPLDALTLSLQLAILVGWFSLVILAGMVRASGAINQFEETVGRFDPRSIFYAGVGLHAFAVLLTFSIARSAPADVVIAAKVGLVLLGLVLFASGLYAASRVPDGSVPLRLAGTLHAAADALKLIWKEDFVPKNADRLLHALAPILAMFPALVTFAVIPFGQPICFNQLPQDRGDFTFADLGHMPNAVPHHFICNGHVEKLQIADLNVGLLYLFAMAGTGVIGAALAGWASDNKFSLMGGLRAASQMVSYEVGMGLSLVGLFLIVGSVRLSDIVVWQQENAWGIFVQPVAFFLFLTAICAETKRVPFDQPEGESEIVAGYFVEYSGMKFGMFFTGEYVELITSSALLVTLFFGGYALPFLHPDGLSVAFGKNVLFSYPMNHLAVVIVSVVAFLSKTILMVWVQIFFRWTLPRFRYDQLMKLGWTKLLPYALANMMVTGILVVAIDGATNDSKEFLQLLADVSQASVALLALIAVVALISGLLEPVDRKKFLSSTAARFASAAGGTHSGPQQA